MSGEIVKQGQTPDPAQGDANTQSQGNANTQTQTETKAPSSFRLIFTLGLAGLLSGLAIVSVYELTLPTITANNAKALRAAVFQVVPGSSRVQKLVPAGDTIAPASATTEEKGAEGPEPAIYGAYDDQGKFIGYAIPAEGNGFQDVIKLLYGYDPVRRRIVGMRVLESRETPGLGDNIYKDPKFAGNFDDLAVDPEITLVKAERSNPNEVTAITGATISSKAVVKIVNGGNQMWLSRLPEPGGEPPLVGEGS